MSNIKRLLELSKTVVKKSLTKLKKLEQKEKTFYFSKSFKNEMKSEVDVAIEDLIINSFKKEKISILSEESGFIKSEKSSNLKLVIDPLDGTVNFNRNLGLSSVSIALLENQTIVFGVLGVYPECKIAWGGKNFGSWYDGIKLNVSNQDNLLKSVLCTGIPTRLNLNDKDQINKFLFYLKKFGKVRMFGAASISLLKVAQGNTELYSENNIMIWDVAAGLAIVEGAGGEIKLKPSSFENSFDVLFLYFCLVDVTF